MMGMMIDWKNSREEENREIKTKTTCLKNCMKNK